MRFRISTCGLRSAFGFSLFLAPILYTLVGCPSRLSKAVVAAPSGQPAPAPQASSMSQAQVQIYADYDMMNLNFEIVYLRCQGQVSGSTGNPSPVAIPPNAGAGLHPNPQQNSYLDWLGYVAANIQSGTQIDANDAKYAALVQDVLTGLTPIAQNDPPCSTTNLRDISAQQAGLQASADGVGKKLVSDFIVYDQPTRGLAATYLRSKQLP